MSKSNKLNKKILIKEYIINKRAGKQISKILNCSVVTVYRYLKKYGIKIRTISESLKGKYVGNNAFHYINGITIYPKYCKVCGKEIKRWKATKCRACSHKKGIRRHYCKCGKEIWNGSKQCKSCSRKGKLHWNWIKNRKLLDYTYEFNKELKEKIRKRDNYTCQICGINEEEHISKYRRVLHVHHIDYNKKNCLEDNLISLCNSCHTETNYNRNYWKEFYEKKIKMIYNKV